MTIKSCATCGGLYATAPGELFAGTPCRCVCPSSNEPLGMTTETDALPYPDQAQDPFWKVPGMVDTRPKAQPPAASVTDAMVRRAQDCLHDKGKDIGYYHMRAALEAAIKQRERGANNPLKGGIFDKLAEALRDAAIDAAAAKGSGNG